MILSPSRLSVILSAIGLLLLVALGVSHYEGRVSGLLHMDVPFGRMNDVPGGVVLYTDAAYDGMLYYQVARDISKLFLGGEITLDSPYRFQRILLPLIVFTLTAGHEPLFPHALLLVNLACAIGTLILMLRLTGGRVLHSLSAILNPAVLVGILYTLTEPLSLFFMVVFFTVWQKRGQRLTAGSLAALMLSLLARETTVFLIGLLFLWVLWKRQWRDAALLVIPIVLFIGWQYFLDLRLGAAGFQANSNIVTYPFGGPISVITRLMDNAHPYLLSSLALMLFVLPLAAALGKEWIEKRWQIGFRCFLLSGLCFTMLIMDEHMWGAITSIGRVVTPIYPVYALYAAANDTWIERSLSVILIVISCIAAIGIASIPHPYILS